MAKFYIAVMMGLLIFSSAARASSGGLNIFALPREAPQTEIYAETGQKVKLTDFHGQFLIVVFWSKTCVPCIKELDNLNNFANKTKGDGFRVLLVSKAQEWRDMDEQRRFLAKYKAPDLEFYIDDKGALTEAFGIFSSPHTVLINKSGQEIGRIRGSVEWDDDDVIEYMYKLKVQHG